MSQRAPDLLFVIGPPAVGKMAVGAEICARTGFKLLHNHMTIEPLLRLFEWENPAFLRLVTEFRNRILEEVAASEVPGLVFTVVWAFDIPAEADAMHAYAAPFRAAGSRIMLAELEATLDERLRRNETEFRLSEKASKRDIAASRARLLEHEDKHRFNSFDGELDDWTDYVRIETTALSAEQTADRIIDAFGLGRG